MPSEKRPTQVQLLIDTMSNGNRFTLRELAAASGASEAGASARLRDIRKLGWIVDRHKITNHYFSYSIRRPDGQERLWA